MLTILHQDAHLVAVDKPPGLLVHRTGLDAGETRFALQMLRDQLDRQVWPAHRLDKGTSGVLVFARHAEALRVMNTGKITSLFVVDEADRPVGILHIHDLLRAGVA